MRPSLDQQVHIDWFKAHSQASLRRYLGSTSASAADLLEYLSPFGSPYHSSLNPVFLVECENLKQLDHTRSWLARDGIVPLVWFFSRFPNPRGFHGKIYLPADLAPLAPAPWRPRIGTYEFGELPRSQLLPKCSEYPLPRTELIFLGIASPAYCSLKHLKQTVTQARSRFEAKFGRAPGEISVCLVQKVEPLGTAEDSSRHAGEMLLALCRELGTKLKITDLRDFIARVSFSSAAILELNERQLCVDNSLIHAAVGKGAALLGEPLHPKADRFVRTTLSHGFALNEKLPSRPNSEALMKRLEDAMASPANNYFPWHHWSERENTERLESSTLTGVARYIRTGSRDFSVLSKRAHGSVDVIYLGADRLEIHGWAVDEFSQRTPLEFYVFRNARRLIGRTERLPRADVQRNLKRKFNDGYKPGFIFKLNRASLEDPKISDRFSIYCLFNDGTASLLGEFKLDVNENQSQQLARKNSTVGTYLPLKISASELELTRVDGASRTAKYSLRGPDAYYQSRLEVCTVDGGEASFSGWAADFHRSRPAEAIVVFGGSRHALVVPLLERRPDIAESMANAMVSGFRLTAPWVRPRIFILYDSNIAVELRVPSGNGSA